MRVRMRVRDLLLQQVLRQHVSPSTLQPVRPILQPVNVIQLEVARHRGRLPVGLRHLLLLILLLHLLLVHLQHLLLVLLLLRLLVPG